MLHRHDPRSMFLSVITDLFYARRRNSGDESRFSDSSFLSLPRAQFFLTSV